MTNDWQSVLSTIIVLISAALLIRSEVRRRRKAKFSSCGHDCGCHSHAVVKNLKKGIASNNQKL